jgi:hypothetical protein
MKRFLILIFVLIPVLGEAQSIHSSDLIIKPDQNEEISISKSDVITPVMMRNPSGSGTLIRSLNEKAGMALLSSALIPGSAQAAQGNWVRAGIYMAVEIGTIYLHINSNNRAQSRERSYENWADQNWSVMQYAQWLVEYHDFNSIPNPHIEDLRAMVNGFNPAFDTSIDWQRVNIQLLRNVERNTPYIVTDNLAASNFSHVLPDYGSQQYYELISKYYQYAPGWRDYYPFHNEFVTNPYFIDRAGGSASPMFFEGVDRSYRFNQDYRTANNLLLLLITNHMISAFDAYFTVRVKQNRLQATPIASPYRQIQISWYF